MPNKSSTYGNSSRSRSVIIGGRKVSVDSDLEERVLRILESSGFSGRWKRQRRGISFQGFHYSPDLELAIERSDGTHRAIIEIKPSKSFFTSDRDLQRRMLGIAGYYGTKIFLLYVGVGDENSWYLIDPTTAELSPAPDLVPGRLGINQLHEPAHFWTWRVHDHHYSARPEIARHAIKWATDALEALMLATFRYPKSTKHRRKKK